jgi:hypothetical protein
MFILPGKQCQACTTTRYIAHLILHIGRTLATPFNESSKRPAAKRLFLREEGEREHEEGASSAAR